jgi:hypothetical protein
MKKKIKEKDTLRLMRWADDNFPPIDLSNELPAVLELIKEVRKLRKEMGEAQLFKAQLKDTLRMCLSVFIIETEPTEKRIKEGFRVLDIGFNKWFESNIFLTLEESIVARVKAAEEWAKTRSPSQNPYPKKKLKNE